MGAMMHSARSSTVGTGLLLYAFLAGGCAWHTAEAEHYRPLHRLCALLLESSGAEARTGGIQLTSFLLDMNKLFEGFVVGVRMWF